MAENVYTMQTPSNAWRRKWLEGIIRSAQRELRLMDEAESLTQQQVSRETST